MRANCIAPRRCCAIDDVPMGSSKTAAQPSSRRAHDPKGWPRIEAELEAIDGVADLIRAFVGKVAVGSPSPYHKGGG